MAYIATISDARRFTAEGELGIFAIYDSCRSHTLYAPVGISDTGAACFVDEPRAYFDDEVTQL